MPRKTFVGFGFGAIQAGLFLPEAYKQGFRMVVSEVVPGVVSAVNSQGSYSLNEATLKERLSRTIPGVELLNPADSDDLAKLVNALAEADVVATALPKVDFYDSAQGMPTVAQIMADGLGRNTNKVTVYTAERV